MNNYAGEEYIPCKEWIADMIRGGHSWDEVEHLCTEPECERDEFDNLQNEELIIPPNMEVGRSGAA